MNHMPRTIRTKTLRSERENSAPSVAIADAPEEEQRNGQAGRQAKEEKQPPAPEQTFWELLGTLDDRWQTEGLSLYCYRLWPITDNRNPERFLCKLQEAVDEDWILKNFGSGKYWLVLNDGKGKHIRKHVSNPHNPDFPPRVAPQEVIESNPQNKLYFQVWGAKDGHPAATQRAESNGAEPANGSDGAVRELAGLLKLALGDKRKEEGDTVTKTLITWALAQKDKERADNSPTAVATLVKELKDLLPSPQQPATVDPLAIVEKVMSIQGRGGTDLAKLWDIVEKAQGRREEPADPIHTMKETVALFTEVRQLFKGETGAAAGSRGHRDSPSWQQMLVDLTANAAPTLNALTGFIGMLKGNANAQSPSPGVATGRPPDSPFLDPYKDAARMREFVKAQNATAAAPPPSSAAAAASAPAPASGMGDHADASNGATLNSGVAMDEGGAAQLVALVNTALGCLNRGVSGHECAEGLILLNGELQFEAIVGQMRELGAPVVVDLAKGLPQIGPQVSAYELPLKRFLAELLEGPQWQEDGTGA